MESAACRRRASDAEQAAWAYSVTAECEPVKEEPEWGECGVSEAAAAEGLYADHEVKDEVVIGPEVVQQQDVAFSIQSSLNRTKEAPCKLEPAGGAGAAPECTHTRPGEGPRCNMSHEQQLRLRSYSVRLKRILVEDLPTCNNCGKQYLQKRHLVKHLAMHHVKSVRGILLQHSTDDARIVNTAETSYSDTASKSPSRNQPVLVPHTGEKPSLFRCVLCYNMFTRKQDLIKHVIVMHKHSVSQKTKLYKCFSTRKSLTDHNRYHRGEKPYSCDNCIEIFRYSNDLAEHKEIRTRDKPHSCTVCNKQFTSVSNLNKHKRIHRGQKLFSCDICKKKFKQKGTIITHIRTHTGEKPFSCDVCKSQFTRIDHLVEHRRTHTGEKPFSCDVCKSQFTRKDNLARHRRIHTGEKPFSCDVCKLQFSHRGNLAVHRRTHTGEKPFSCVICKFQFTHKSDLAKHGLTHTGEKPFSCDICKSQFARHHSLTVHRRIHTGEKPFSCEVCKSQFARSDSLALHRRIHTGEKL